MRFNVYPQIQLNSGKILEHESIRMLTFVPKLMGGVDENWFDLLKHATELNWNCIHLTPIEQLGVSNSAYCLYDQITIAPDLYPNLETNEQRLKEFPKFLDRARKELDLMFITDIVLNHTAANTPWISEHPEAAYNTRDCPWLIPAYELDSAIADWFREFDGLPKESRTKPEVDKLLTSFKNVKWPQLKMWEHFVIDVESELSHFKGELRNAIDTKSYNKPTR